MARKIPLEIKSDILLSVEDRLFTEINKKDSPEKIAERFNNILSEEFSKERKLKDDRYNLPLIFVGQYKINSDNPTETLLYSSVGHGCSPIPLDSKVSIIARCVETGDPQHIPDVSKDSSHWECDAKAMAEEVYPILSEKPYSKDPYRGYYAVVGVFDIDFSQKNALDERESRELERICKPYGNLIFPDEPKSVPNKKIFTIRPVSRRFIKPAGSYIPSIRKNTFAN